MKYLIIIFWFFLVAQVHGEDSPIVNIHTNIGTIVLELNPSKAPKTVANFLRYAVEGFYNGTIFHRVIIGYIIQGGGYTQDYEKKEPTYEPIPNENNGLKNKLGTIAMARNPYDPDSATTQFFINLKDNESLDAPGTPGEGYTVFGHVIESMDVINKIQRIRIGSKGDLKKYVPQQQVFIERITIENLPESFNVPKHLPPALDEKMEAEMDSFGLTDKEETEETEIAPENQTETTISRKNRENLSEKPGIESENALAHELEEETKKMDNFENKTENVLTHELLEEEMETAEFDNETTLTDELKTNDIADLGNKTENALTQNMSEHISEEGDIADFDNKTENALTQNVSEHVSEEDDIVDFGNESENALTDKFNTNDIADLGNKTDNALTQNVSEHVSEEDDIVDFGNESENALTQNVSEHVSEEDDIVDFGNESEKALTDKFNTNDIADLGDKTGNALTQNVSEHVSEEDDIVDFSNESENALTDKFNTNDIANLGNKTGNALTQNVSEHVSENDIANLGDENENVLADKFNTNSIANKGEQTGNILIPEESKDNLETMENTEFKAQKDTEISLSHHELRKNEMEKNGVVDKIRPSAITVTDKNMEEQTFQTSAVSPPTTIEEQTSPSQTTPLTKAETRVPAYLDSPAQFTLVIGEKIKQTPNISEKKPNFSWQRFLFPPDPPSQPDKPALLPN